MYNQDLFFQALIYLGAAVISVPLARKLGLGSVLGYLFAGIVIGPFVLGLVGKETSEVMHFAEFGVVIMLFIIGLELEPSLLWKMRKTIFGLGGLQVIITTVVIAALALPLGLQLNKAVAIGLILALSSTAIVIQTLTEKGLLKNISGRSAFAVLLFQDIAVIPIIAVLPILAVWGNVVPGTESLAENSSPIASLPGWLQLLIIIGVIGGIIFGGRFMARYVFRLIAETGLHELFTAMGLLMIIGIALAMDAIGLSPALGTFIAGVVLANNEYSHELESTIEPFKGLLLGLFFISVGASINFLIFIQSPWLILGLLSGFILIKFIVLLLLGRIFRLSKGHEFLFAFLLAQSSEFGFVLISFSKQIHLFDEKTAGILLLMVTLSMAVSPLLLILHDKTIQPVLSKRQNKTEYDEVDEYGNPVIIAGFGRFGLAIGRFLLANNIKITIIDGNPANVEILRKYGFKLFYGDVTKPQVLEQAGIKYTKMLILSMAEYDDALKVAAYVRKNYPAIKVLARAKDIFHAFEFFRLHVKTVQREMFNSATELGMKALIELGFSKYEAYRAARTFRHHENEVMEDLYRHWNADEKKFIQESRRFSQQLSETLLTERNYTIHDTDCAWDTTLIRDEERTASPDDHSPNR